MLLFKIQAVENFTLVFEYIYENFKHNMKKTFLFACLIAVGLSYGQDFKVKKNEVLIDGAAAAKISDSKGIYTLTDLNGNPLFSARIESAAKIGGTDGSSWIELTGANGKVKEVKDLSTAITFSKEKIILGNVIQNYKLIGTSGPDMSAIQEFFATEDRGFSTAILEKLAALKAENDADDQIAADNKISFDEKGNILQDGKKIGATIVTKSNNNGVGLVETEASIVDLNKMIVAKYKYANSPSQVSLGTYDGVLIPAFIGPQDVLSQRLVKKLYAKGYKLGDMKAEAEGNLKDKNSQRIADARANSLNLYDTAGYVIDAKGNKTEGLITIEFESIDAILGANKGTSDLTNYGGSVELKDSTGKSTFFKAKDGVKFCAGTRCFLGTKGSEDGGINSGSGSQLSVLGESQFFEIAYEKDENYVLNHVKSKNAFYLKLKKQDKAVYLGDKAMIGSRSQDKTQKIFASYINCPSLSFGDYDRLSKEGMQKLVDDYVVKCVK